MLEAQAWRAARLVVDTGIHAFRWTRDQSVQLLRDIGLSQLEAETETDRYITWPGQALAYMTGMREIVALRRELEERDGDRFDLVRVPRRAAGPRHAAAGDDAPRAAGVGQAARLGSADARAATGYARSITYESWTFPNSSSSFGWPASGASRSRSCWS